MSFTKCCNHRFIGDNHSPIQPDGYCLHCGFHPEIESLNEEIGIYKANERLARHRNEALKKENEELKKDFERIKGVAQENYNRAEKINETRTEEIKKLQKENEELKEALDYVCRGLGFYTDFRTDTGRKLSDIIEKWLKGEKK